VIKVVIAESFARFFFRNAINNAFVALACPGIGSIVKTDDQLEINIRTATVNNLSSNAIIKGRPLSQNVIAILSEGGLVNYARKTLERR